MNQKRRLAQLRASLRDPVRLVGWVWFAGCFAVLLVLLYRHAGGWFHSDHSCDLLLSKLLSQEGGILSSDWLYSTELMVFNSQLVYIPLFWLTNNWSLIHFLGIAIMLVCTLASCWYFCRQSSLSWLFPFFAAVLVLPLSEDYFDNMLLGAYYTAYTFLAFLSMGLTFRMLEARLSRRFWAGVVVLGVLGFVSGTNGLRQLMVQYLPLLAGALFMLWRATAQGTDRATVGKMVRLVQLTLFGTVCSGLGYLLNSRVLSHIYQYKDYEQVLYYIELHDYRLEALLNGWLSSFGYNTQSESGSVFDFALTLQNGLAFLLILLVCLSLYAILRHPAEYRLEEYTLACFFTAGFLLFAALFLLTSMPYNARYNISLVIFCIPLVAIYLRHLHRPRTYRMAVGGVLICLLTLSAALFYQHQRQVNVNVGRQEVADAMVADGYTQGYATYWNGNILTELTDGALEMWCWAPDAQSVDPGNMNHGLQLASHLDNPPQGPFFVLFSDEEMQTYAMPQLLDPDRILYQNAGYTAFGYEDYAAFAADLND